MASGHERQWFPKSRNPFMPWNTMTGAVDKHAHLNGNCGQWHGRAEASITSNHLIWCDTRHNPYETGARGPQRAHMRETTRTVAELINHWRSVMSWYIAVLKKYAVFNGRARRKEYWYFFLINFIIGVVLGVLSAVLARSASDSGSMSPVSSVISCISSIYSLAVLLPGLGVGIRRLHDIGKSGWWLLIGLIPLIGEIWLLVLAATDSQPGDNQYGPNPKMEAQPMAPTMTQP
jgi:uncharacterized membrane protein YhaH (DUF805 family)